MGRRPCCEKVGLKRGPWTVEEDHKLMSFILSNGIHCWRLVPKLAGLLRCGKSCRLRWVNYLRPDLKRGAFSEVEEDQIIQLHSRYGNKWSKIASHFPGRTDNEIKNHWNTRIKKRLKRLGLDTQTHNPAEENCQNKENNANKLPHSASVTEEKSDIYNVQLESPGQVYYESEKELQLSEAGCSDGTTYVDDYEMIWKSLDTESVETVQNNGSNHEMGTSLLNHDLQSWLDHMESMLFSDIPDGQDEFSY